MAKILVVDDEVDLANVAKLVLEIESHEVFIVTDPEMAVQKALEEKPDVILLDVVMPNVDGYDILKEVRQEPDLQKTRVAMLTSKNKSLDVMVGMHMLNVDDYIIKPYGKQDLLDRVRKILEKDEN